MAHHVLVQSADFSVADEYQALLADAPQVGAVVTFAGLVRDMNLGDGVTGLFLEHYPGMTEKSLQAVIDEACQRWQVISARVIHRVGYLQPGDQIVFVGVNSAHREVAFAACEFMMDALKTRAPFWKKEVTEDGERWLDARKSDQQRAERWRK